jgi:hypothetical protein
MPVKSPKISIIRGDHETIMTEPYRLQLAELIAAELRT